MAEIETQRLRLIPLTLQQLLTCRENRALLQSSLDFPLAQDAISEAALRAIDVKINKMQHVPMDEHPWYTYWVLICKPENIGVGLAGFKGAPNASGDAELGYGISPRYQNQGLMTEAVAGLVNWAVSQTECRGIIAETLRDNPASQRVLEKNGFKIIRESATALFWRLPCQQENPTSKSWLP